MVTIGLVQDLVGPGHNAPARSMFALFLSALLLSSQSAGAQQRQQLRQQPQSSPAAPQVRLPSLPIPDANTLAKIIWSTMAAVDHANKTGNYSVLRDLGSPGFQAGNSAATLAAVFAGIRSRQIDLTDTLSVTPSYELAPQIIQPNVMRLRGFFNTRPNQISFDLLFEWNSGWRLEGVAVQAAPPTTLSR